MAFAILAGMVLASAPVHETTVELASSPVNVSYHVTSTLDTRQTNAAHVTRQGFGNCHWTATVQMERQVRGEGNAPVAALDKPVGAPTLLEGTLPGLCDAARGNIEAQLSSRIRKMQANLVNVAQADHPALLAEIRSVAMLPRASGG